MKLMKKARQIRYGTQSIIIFLPLFHSSSKQSRNGTVKPVWSETSKTTQMKRPKNSVAQQRILSSMPRSWSKFALLWLILKAGANWLRNQNWKGTPTEYWEEVLRICTRQETMTFIMTKTFTRYFSMISYSSRREIKVMEKQKKLVRISI